MKTVIIVPILTVLEPSWCKRITIPLSLRIVLNTCRGLLFDIPSDNNIEKVPAGILPQGLSWKTAATYSPTFAVPSARLGLTSLFGMGRGGTPALSATLIGFDRLHTEFQHIQHAKHTHFFHVLTTYVTRRSVRIIQMHGYGKFRAISSARLWCHHLYTCTLSTSSSLTTL